MRLLLFVLAVLLSVPPVHAQLSVDLAFPNLSFSSPVGLENDGVDAGRLYVVEQAGVIRTFENDPEVASSSAFLNITDRVDNGPNEAGLLGLAFHPDYETNGYLFVSYTIDGSPITSRISRFTRSTSDLNTADPASELVLLEIPQPFGNHNGGGLVFGPDGYLYASFGDGGAGGDPEENAQDATNLLGAILRLDVDGGGTPPDCGGADANYTVPPNGLADGAGGVCDEIYAYGLRNPWRFSFDRLTGQGWVADVGQNQWEEISILEDGGNFGWDVKEGEVCFETPGPGEPACDDPSLIDPVWVYSSQSGSPHCSITGGYVYRGADVPEIAGRYIYGDYCSGSVWALDNMAVTIQSELVHQFPASPFPALSSFGEDLDGELYLVRRDGEVYRFNSESDTSGEGTPGRDDLSFELSGPNPFRGQTSVAVALATPGEARVTVYDVLGREIAVLWDGVAAEEVVTFDADGLPAGMYILRLETERGSATRKVLHLR